MKKNSLILISLLGSLLAAITCGVSAFLLPHLPLVWQISGAVALILFAIHFFLDYASFAAMLSKKTTRYGLNSVVMSVIVLSIVVIANLIANEHDWKKDLTKNKIHTLSDQSIKLLKGLTTEIRLKAFVYPNQVPEFENIFSKYTYYTKKLTKEFIDPDKDPFAVDRYKIKTPGTIIIESDARQARVENLFSPDDPKLEEKLTNAIIQVAKGEKRKIYFLSGHGERLVSDTGREGYSEIKETLESGRYKVEELVLLQKDQMPEDAEIIVCVGPKSDFLAHELKMLEDYLKAGGKALFMMEPTSTTSLKPLLAKFGAEWKNNKTIFERNPLQQLAGGNPVTPIVTSYDGSHEITQDARQVSIFPIPAPVEKGAIVPTGLKVTSLFSTSPRSLEVEMAGDKIQVDEKKDRKGPISLALAIAGTLGTEKKEEPAKKPEEKKEGEKAKDTELRLVVVGDADFASNGVKKVGINSDLFQNMLSWLSKEEDLISIRPRPADLSEFEITEARSRVIFLASVVGAPLIMLLAGIGVWLSRKSR